MKMVYENLFGGPAGIVERDAKDVSALMKDSNVLHVVIMKWKSRIIEKDIESSIKNIKIKPNCALIQIRSNNPLLKTKEVRKISEAVEKSIAKNGRILWGLSIDKKAPETEVCVLLGANNERAQLKRLGISTRKGKRK